MALDRLLFSTLLFALVELIIGYLVLYIIGILILIPNKCKIHNVNDIDGQNKTKHEIKKVRRIMYLFWTVMICVINVVIILTT